jgi:sugar phosphate isomerase/epimerase
MTGPHVHVPYDGIEKYLSFIQENRINIEVYFSSGSLDVIRGSDISRLRERLEYGTAFTIHAPFMDLSPGAVDSKVRTATIERFSQVFDIAGILNPRTIVFHSGYEKWKYALKTDLWLEKSVTTWKPFVSRAADMGLRVAIENIFEDDPVSLRLLMEEIGSEYFGVCFDTGHFNLFSKVPLDEWLRQMKPYIVELHLHDNNKKCDDHAAIGEGTFDFATLFSILRDQELVYTVEAHSPEDVLKSIEMLKAYLPL